MYLQKPFSIIHEDCNNCVSPALSFKPKKSLVRVTTAVLQLALSSENATVGLLLAFASLCITERTPDAILSPTFLYIGLARTIRVVAVTRVPSR